MDRQAWLRERRDAVEAQYDLESPEYDSFEYPVPLHGRFVDKLIATTNPGAIILDAPCGTGKYFGHVVAAGRRVVGMDQSAGMLAQARSKGLADSLEHVGLQEITVEAAFDAAMTIDAMENVSPEDWPMVVGNLRRALRDGGHLYLTLEEMNEPEVEEAHGHQQALGWPSVRGEIIEGDTAGYHYYPGRDQAIEWLTGAGFSVVAEDVDRQQGWGYRHFLLRAE
jgi:cyclopropane fatty-acyl-phospholipid synthase-like methyltransferase